MTQLIIEPTGEIIYINAFYDAMIYGMYDIESINDSIVSEGYNTLNTAVGLIS